MIWLLMVVYLNLSVNPPHIDHAGSFQSEQACVEKQKEFIEQSKEVQVPDNFNLGCIPFNRKVM